MKVFVVLSVLAVAAVSARPEPPVGGGYPSYSAPSFSSGGDIGPYPSSQQQGGGGGYNYQPATQVVQKHIYVHVPPPEKDDAPAPRVVQSATPQKHYKIIFIKAPTPPQPKAPIIPPPPQNEEKTLVYVLHKKPEEPEEIILPTPPPTKPSKPEVYFIKYKTQKEKKPEYGPPKQEYGAPSGNGGPY
ncbi:conserved hypothetical protein [Culex quinquefasciatus]|uniref:DUF243 domain-containing protein n=1 Tax=Culex quinquefasciatus TaxID=7176 RepID=B0W2A9_CULQU|nr:extensin [Culex quinquefasciatus]EDS28724.1 conserved hypothetical protein [Culex quinquefasciatus]|eukprot:XP_001842881.1 conserved hypothetical protein [Culex quinquefasciatus]